MQNKSLIAALFAASTMAVVPARAVDLVYTPINPSFGGSPLNSSHLLGLANAQRDATASDAKTTTGTGGTGSGDTGGGDSDVDLFIRQLQGRLLSALASQVTEAIFGDNPQDNGTIQFGGTTVEFERTIDSITLRITNDDGTVTVITVPQLVTTTGGASLLAASPMSSEGLQPTLPGALAGSSSLTQQPLSQSLTTPLN
jgi:curli production assembly/transport component CsgF